MLKLKVEGMTCNHCVMAVKKALMKVPGVEKAEVSLERAEALVEGKADPEALIRAVEEEGYRAALAG
ncbi:MULTISPECIES: cation transporter [Thermus]|uniref:Heavy metal-binding protein n=3 Tax=Thermus TaxID=270 RepID=A0A0N0ZPX8_THESC|nr:MULTISPECIES: cation transporter [Thermus]KPD32980.1 heavy metal-binding protein [Thermus scotoductus]ADW21025.1 putative heavy metal-binding protein [Thermus scotoductus SA-01]KHG66465.1 heavy metal-binding protein [Thermus sp. 2.9]MBW6395348.1 cation transporter [Thermus brevis]UZX16281.1 cation transporter [Thermus sp. PS18]